MNVAVATRMTVDEIGLAHAIFCKLYADDRRIKADARVSRRYLDPTPRAHFDEAVAWASSNAKVVRLLRDAPETVSAQSYTLNPARGFFGRLLGLGRSKGATAPDDDELAVVMREIAEKKQSTPKKKRKDLDDLRSLVDESLKG